MAKILLIGKDGISCNFLRQQLSQKGYEIVMAMEGGDQGILLAVTTSPDLIVIDTDLAVINGWQAIKILKASTVTQKIPVIVLTTPISHADWKRVSESNCDDYSLKPVHIGSLLGKIESLLSGLSVAGSSQVDHKYDGTSNRWVKDAALEVTRQPQPVFVDTSEPIINPPIPNQKAVEQASLTGSTVVYIDDNPADSHTMAEIVKGAGYQYAAFGDSLQALPLLIELKPQLIFLDLVMPVVNGYELCAQIRRISTLKHIPVIIVTNNDGIADRVRAKVVGSSGFLGKPIKEKRVLKVLKRYLQPVRTNENSSEYSYGFLPSF